MHPALSVIFFTSASGIGYGVLILLGLLLPLGLLPDERAFGATALGLALGAVTLGLLASTAHLARPERAWRAFSQWRSSWLSREGVASVLTYLPATAFAVLWSGLGRHGAWVAVAALAAAAFAAATLFCTGMIYRSLKPVQRWANHWTVPVYFALAFSTGALWLNLAACATGHFSPALGWLAAALAVLAGLVKEGYWRFIDRTAAVSTAASATGLGNFGAVRLLEAPHTSENYLMKEMGFQVARRHAAKLRRITRISAFVLPAALSLAGLILPGPAPLAMALVSALLASLGVFVERWLFFAEAKHTVTLYYGSSTA